MMETRTVITEEFTKEVAEGVDKKASLRSIVNSFIFALENNADLRDGFEASITRAMLDSADVTKSLQQTAQDGSASFFDVLRNASENDYIDDLIDGRALVVSQ